MIARRRSSLSWARTARLGVVQMSLGAVVVLMTSVLNRVLVVELGLPASVPGALVALHFLVQLARAPLGFGSDRRGRRTPWIVGGMAVLAAGGLAAAGATALMARSQLAGIIAATVAFAVIGVGVGASGTALLAFMAERVEARRRAPAAALLWIMMIAGLAVTAGTAGSLLAPFSMTRLVLVVGGVCVAALLLTVAAMWGMEDGMQDVVLARPVARHGAATAEVPFGTAFRAVWDDPPVRRCAWFIFVAMLAYSAQDLILEPFAGTVFAMTPAESTRLGGMQHAGALVGMLFVAVLGMRVATPRIWAVAGCAASAGAFALLAMAPSLGAAGMLTAIVFSLGVANGAFAIGALATMMTLTVSDGAEGSGAGLRMGVFGAAQAIAYAFGGLAGAAASDLARLALRSAALGYATVFAGEALLFLAAAVIAARTHGRVPVPAAAPATGRRAPHLLAR